ncbi:ABC transporter ATP-binding protein [Aeoliella mucimassa]|nr:ATP-binding cassette domain-containing protein [Aeoliella mucimassa]
MIELQAVDYTQQETEIIRQVSWQLRTGEHWAILGPNGSGKTTLLKLACGYEWPSGGRVLRHGEELIDLREWRKRIGWIANDLVGKVPKRDLALETVVTGRTAQVGLRYLPTFKPSEQDFADAAERLQEISCSHLAEKPFGVLSQGERQQVLFARARMADPVLLVLDEPCAGMDPGVRERFLAWLDAQLSKPDGPTTLLVTHHVEEIMPSITHTLLMSDGEIAQAGPTSEVVSKATIESAYQTKLAELRELGGRRWPIWG